MGCVSHFFYEFAIHFLFTSLQFGFPLLVHLVHFLLLFSQSIHDVGAMLMLVFLDLELLDQFKVPFAFVVSHNLHLFELSIIFGISFRRARWIRFVNVERTDSGSRIWGHKTELIGISGY